MSTSVVLHLQCTMILWLQYILWAARASSCDVTTINCSIKTYSLVCKWSIAVFHACGFLNISDLGQIYVSVFLPGQKVTQIVQMIQSTCNADECVT